MSIAHLSKQVKPKDEDREFWGDPKCKEQKEIKLLCRLNSRIGERLLSSKRGKWTSSGLVSSIMPTQKGWNLEIKMFKTKNPELG